MNTSYFVHRNHTARWHFSFFVLVIYAFDCKHFLPGLSTLCRAGGKVYDWKSSKANLIGCRAGDKRWLFGNQGCRSVSSAFDKLDGILSQLDFWALEHHPHSHSVITNLSHSIQSSMPSESLRAHMHRRHFSDMPHNLPITSRQLHRFFHSLFLVQIIFNLFMVCGNTECFRFLFHIGFVPRLWLSVLTHIARLILLSTRLTMALNHEPFRGVYFQHSYGELLLAIVLLSGRSSSHSFNAPPSTRVNGSAQFNRELERR